MNMKSKFGMFALMALAMGSDAMDSSRTEVYLPTLAEIDARRKQAKEKQNLAKGLKKFVIEGQEIWAISEKVAIKKFNKTK